MNHLFRELAPISDKAWSEITGEANRSLNHFLAGRKLIDVAGPVGNEVSAVPLGRLEPLEVPDGAGGVTAATRSMRPLIELRRSFTLERAELEAFDRGGCDGDLDPLVDACRALAHAEDTLVFEGYPAGAVEGITAASPHDAIQLSTEFEQYPNHVAQAVAVLKDAGVGGPFALALGPRCYAGVIETNEGGYPLLQHLKMILRGPVVWAPAVDGAVLLSQRGDDFELTIGQDTSIAYRSHDADTVTLELQESVAFVAASPEAGIALRHP